MPVRERGFTLMEAAITIAVIAILAGAAIPFAVKGVNQAREQRTRQDLRVMWEALFGAQDRRIGNMRADWGFAPAGTLATLGKLTVINAAPAPNPPAYGANGALFNWGWNGPYWLGSVQVNGAQRIPVDAWGKPVQLRLVAGGFQLISGGANGVVDTAAGAIGPTADDLVFPANPVPLARFSGQLSILVRNNRATAFAGRVEVRFRNNGGLSPINTTVLALAANPGLPGVPGGQQTIPTGTFGSIPNGAVQIQVFQTGIPAALVQDVIDLQPGEVRNLSYVIN